MTRTAARILAIVTLLCPTVATAQGAATPSPQPPPAIDTGAGLAVRGRALSDGPRRARRDQRVDRRRQRGESRIWPRLDSLWQSNRGTANNIFGQVLPQSVIPAMSGPVLPSASGGSVWGSATGALFSWEPFDFGLRQATVAGAEAAVARARASEELTQLDVQTAVGPHS